MPLARFGREGPFLWTIQKSLIDTTLQEKLFSLGLLESLLQRIMQGLQPSKACRCHDSNINGDYNSGARKPTLSWHESPVEMEKPLKPLIAKMNLEFGKICKVPSSKACCCLYSNINRHYNSKTRKKRHIITPPSGGKGDTSKNPKSKVDLEVPLGRFAQ